MSFWSQFQVQMDHKAGYAVGGAYCDWQVAVRVVVFQLMERLFGSWSTTNVLFSVSL